MSRNGQRGEGRLAFFFWLMVLVVVGMIAWEAIPVRMRMAELQDFMVESAERARFRNEDQLKKAIIQRASELDLPVNEDNLKVKINDGQVRIDLAYTVPLNFPLYTYTWRKQHVVDRPIFYW